MGTLTIKTPGWIIVDTENNKYVSTASSWDGLSYAWNIDDAQLFQKKPGALIGHKILSSYRKEVIYETHSDTICTYRTDGQYYIRCRICGKSMISSTPDREFSNSCRVPTIHIQEENADG